MLKCFAIFATVLVLGLGSVSAQQQDIVVRKIEVPGTDFDFVVVMSKNPAGITSGLSDQEHPLVASPTGDWLAFATDCEIERIFGRSRSLIHGFRVERKEGEPSSAVHVYVVSKGAGPLSHKPFHCDRSPAIF
jgi:hypothetical protein